MINLPTFNDFVNEAKMVVDLDQDQAEKVKEVAKITSDFFKHDVISLAKKHGFDVETYKAKSGFSGKSSYIALKDPNSEIEAVGWLHRPAKTVLVFSSWANAATKLDGPPRVDDNLNNTAKPDNSYSKIDLGGETINANGNLFPSINKVRSNWQYYANKNSNVEILTDELIKSYNKELSELIKFLDKWISTEYPKWQATHK